MKTVEYKTTIPGGVSSAGKKFIDALPPAVARLTSADAVEQIRNDGHTEYLPRANRAIKNHSVSYRSVEIGGVSCLELLPGKSQNASGQTLLYFFGGGYIYGGAHDDMCIAAALCHYTGARVIAPEYRLAPEHPYPAATEDGYRVYEALIRDLDPAQIALAGESAGGNLALTVVQRAKQAGRHLPGSMALLSPWCDLTQWEDQQEDNIAFPEDPTLHRDDLNNYVCHYAGERLLSDPGISPIYGAFEQDFPPTMISTATRDVLMPQAIRLARRIQQAGAVSDLRIYPGLCHVFECYDEIPEAEISLKSLSDFLF